MFLGGWNLRGVLIEFLGRWNFRGVLMEFLGGWNKEEDDEERDGRWDYFGFFFLEKLLVWVCAYVYCFDLVLYCATLVI